jgi:hypothetical protein
MDQAKSLGINIRELHHILSPQEVVYMVTTGLGISFSTQGLTQFMYTPGIICRSLAHAPLLLDTHTAIRRGDDSKLVNTFVRAYHHKYGSCRESVKVRVLRGFLNSGPRKDLDGFGDYGRRLRDSMPGR